MTGDNVQCDLTSCFQVCRMSAAEALFSAQSSDIYDLIKDAAPLTPVSAYKNTENRRRHYEQVLMSVHTVVLSLSTCVLACALCTHPQGTRPAIQDAGMVCTAHAASTKSWCILLCRSKCRTALSHWATPSWP